MATSAELDRIAKELFIQLLKETGHAQMRVFGLSMVPAIRPEDIVHVERGPANPGDIVVFERTGRLCAHRLLAIVESQVTTRGDANPGFDPHFPHTEILGRITSVERNGAVVGDLRFRPLISQILRNSNTALRIFLHIHNKLRIRARNRAQSTTSRLAKLQS